MKGARGTAIAAAILLVIGIIWLLQGIGVLGGSVMTGVSIWAWIGGACILVAVILIGRVFGRSR